MVAMVTFIQSKATSNTRVVRRHRLRPRQFELLHLGPFFSWVQDTPRNAGKKNSQIENRVWRGNISVDMVWGMECGLSRKIVVYIYYVCSYSTFVSMHFHAFQSWGG